MIEFLSGGGGGDCPKTPSPTMASAARVTPVNKRIVVMHAAHSLFMSSSRFTLEDPAYLTLKKKSLFSLFLLGLSRNNVSEQKRGLADTPLVLSGFKLSR